MSPPPRTVPACRCSSPCRHKPVSGNEFIAPFPMAFDARPYGRRLVAGTRARDYLLAIEFTSHHTILTDRPERVLHLFVDVLGGRALQTAPNEVRGMLEHLRPARGYRVRVRSARIGHTSPRGLGKTAPDDSYHAITFKVADLEQRTSPPRRRRRRGPQRHRNVRRHGSEVEHRRPVGLHERVDPRDDPRDDKDLDP